MEYFETFEIALDKLQNNNTLSLCFEIPLSIPVSKVFNFLYSYADIEEEFINLSQKERINESLSLFENGLEASLLYIDTHSASALNLLVRSIICDSIYSINDLKHLCHSLDIHNDEHILDICHSLMFLDHIHRMSQNIMTLEQIYT